MGYVDPVGKLNQPLFWINEAVQTKLL